MNRKTYLILCIVIVLVAGGFRIFRIAERSVWLDEARVANYARQSLSNNITKTRLGSSSPIAYPLMLQTFQGVNDSVFTLRLTAALSSMLAILTILALPRFGSGRFATLVAAALLAVSPSQIRYAQELREYSLSVFLASAMVLSLVAALDRRKGALPLVLIVFFSAPLVQYGLVFLVPATLLTLLVAGKARGDIRPALWLACVATPAFVLGFATTYWLTLRGQWGQELAYLNQFMYHDSIFDLSAIFSFLTSNGGLLLPYLTFGNWNIALLILIAGLFFLVRSPAPRDARHIFVFALISVAIVAIASIIGIYPFGQIRQNLFLAPLVAMALGGGWAALIAMTPPKYRDGATAVFVLLIIASGAFCVVHANPYQEVEDIKAVIDGLDERAPGDAVYVFYGARPAIRFYKVGGPEFVYGSCHRNTRHEYLTEFRELVGGDISRVWIVFSHAKRTETRFILNGLARDWRFELAVKAEGARLYPGPSNWILLTL